MTHRDVRTTIMIVAAASVFLFVVSISALAYGLHKVNEVAVSNARVICALREGYIEDRDVAIKEKANTQKYINQYPQGVSLGDLFFSKADLQKTLADVQRRLDALNARLASTEDAVC